MAAGFIAELGLGLSRPLVCRGVEESFGGPLSASIPHLG